jgi:hypothetical protein
MPSWNTYSAPGRTQSYHPRRLYIAYRPGQVLPRFVLGDEACIQLWRSGGYFLLPAMHSFSASALRVLLLPMG